MDSNRLTKAVTISLIIGLIVGAALYHFQLTQTSAAQMFLQILSLGAHTFLGLFKLLVAPVVFISLVSGVGSSDNIVRLGRVGAKAVGYYVACTATAVTLSLLLASWVRPGDGVEQSQVESLQFKAQPLGWLETLKSMVPTNLFKAFIDSEMIQIIVISILVGMAIALAEPKGKKVLEVFDDLNHVMTEWVNLTLKLAPIGVFCLMTEVFAAKGLMFLGPLAQYFILVLVTLVIHMVVVYGGLLKFVGRLSVKTFVKKYKSVMLFAFGTSSSNATLSLNMKVTEESLGVSSRVTAFTLPLGATVNMDGTAIMQGIATLFIAQVYHVDLTFTQMVTVVAMATLASIGTAGVPGVGLITLSMVLDQVGLPIDGIGLILGVDRLLDMSRTVINVTGDAVVSLLVAKSENELNVGVYEAST